MPERRKAVIYVRQSQDRGGTELGISRQRDSCTRLCEQRGWVVTETVVDNEVSASSRKPRPGFGHVLAMVDNRDVDVVVVHHVDRLVRKLVDLEDVIERCERAGVVVGIASGDLDLSTDSGRLVGRILASVARGEMERKSARQRDANQQAAAAGRRMGGRRAFGYRTNGRTIIDREADAIRSAYSAVLAGASLAAIAREWNDLGLRSGQGPWKKNRQNGPAGWTHTTVRRLLLNPRYAGLRRHNGEITAQAEWPALVPEETWRAVCALLADPGRRHRPKGGKRLLTGVATCGVCGEPVHAGGASHGKPIYRCRSMRHINRLAEPVDEWIAAVVVARLSRPDAVELLVDDTRPDVAALRDKAQEIRARIASVGQEFANDDDVPLAQLRAINARLLERLAEVEERMADAGRVDVLGPLISASDVRAGWERLDVDRQRAVVGALMAVRLFPVGTGSRGFRPETVGITWRSGEEA